MFFPNNKFELPKHSSKKKQKMKCIKFKPKAIIVYFEKEERFNYKNIYEYDILANFWLNNISKINCKMLVIMSYIPLRLELRKV